MTMPRSLQYILDHADELAAQAEAYEPTERDLVIGKPLAAVHHAVLGVADAETKLVDAIEAAREAGVSWSELAPLLGVSREAVRRRYRSLVTH